MVILLITWFLDLWIYLYKKSDQIQIGIVGAKNREVKSMMVFPDVKKQDLVP